MFKCDACIKTNKNNSGSKKVKYSYYVSDTKRVKCDKIDKTVIELTRQVILSKHPNLTPAENDEIAKIDWNTLINQEQKYLVRHLISKVIHKDNEVRLEINRDAISSLKEYQSSESKNNNNETFNHQIYISSDQKTINIIADTKTTRIIPITANKTLLKAVATGYRYKKMIEEQNQAVDTIAKSENKNRNYIARIVNIGYLSPRIIEDIFTANHNESLTVSALEAISAKSSDWRSQEIEFQKYQ